MKLFYLANLRLPTEKAHGVQIMKMCEAFQVALNPNTKYKIQDTRYNGVTLVVPFRFRSPGLRGVKDVLTYYGVKAPFRIITLPSLDFFPLALFLPFLDRLAFAFQYGSFLFFVICYLLFVRCRDGIVYTRDPRLVRLARRFSPNVFFELHTIPKANDVSQAISARGVIVLTRRLKDMLVSHKVPAEKILVAPDAVDIVAFEAVKGSSEDLRKRFNLPPRILIGYAGRLKTMGEEKGIPELLKAFAILKNDVREKITLCILGADPDERERYAASISDLGILGAVRFIPRVPPTEVPKYLKAFDVLVAPFPDTPHYRDAMSPLKIFEYMAAGRPVVATDLPSVREILNERNAVLIKPGDAMAFARGMRQIIEDPKSALRMLTQARRDAEAYTWTGRAGTILEYITQ